MIHVNNGSKPIIKSISKLQSTFIRNPCKSQPKLKDFFFEELLIEKDLEGNPIIRGNFKKH